MLRKLATSKEAGRTYPRKAAIERNKNNINSSPSGCFRATPATARLAVATMKSIIELSMAVTGRLLTLAYCFVGAAALAAEPTTPFSCEGPFGRDTSYARLVSTYGAANVTNEEDAEADSEVTILFPKYPARRLKFLWKNKKARRNPSVITFDEHSSWSVAGVTMKTALVELERLNGGPYKLNFFEGDYGGAITDWLGGHFNASQPGGCWFGAFVTIVDRVPDAVSEALNAEITRDDSLLSSGPGLRAANPVVSEMSVAFQK